MDKGNAEKVPDQSSLLKVPWNISALLLTDCDVDAAAEAAPVLLPISARAAVQVSMSC